MKTIRARQLILKKIFMLWPKKNSCKEFDDEKKIPAARKFPSPRDKKYNQIPTPCPATPPPPAGITLIGA